LKRPSDKFFPLKKYRRLFGDPLSAKNKKLKHVVSVVDGIRGVVVPGEDSDDSQPWELINVNGKRIEHDESEDVGSDGGEDEVAAERFQILKDNETRAHAEIAQGAMMSILQTMELTTEERVKEQTQSAKKKSAKKRNKTKKNVKTQSTLKSFLGVAEGDSDESDQDAGKQIKHKAKKALLTVRVSAGGAAAGSSSGAIDVEQHEVVEEAGTEGDNEGGPQKGRGAPKKDVLAMEANFWNEIVDADEHSVYFCKVSDVQRRLVVRWANTARTKAASCGDANLKAKYEGVAKRLQIIELIIALHRKWVQRSGDVARSYAEFESAFNVLETFAVAAPAQPLRCQFLWDLRLQTQALRR
jgi:hypothetical protein